MQCGQRMIRIVSVCNGCSCAGAKETCTRDTRQSCPMILLKTRRIVARQNGVESELAPGFWQRCRQAGRRGWQKRPAQFSNGRKTKGSQTNILGQCGLPRDASRDDSPPHRRRTPLVRTQNSAERTLAVVHDFNFSPCDLSQVGTEKRLLVGHADSFL